MAENTKIEWADHTFNGWIGCTKVSPACDGCYAEAQMGMPGRFGPARVEWGGPGKGEGTRSRTAESTWEQPLAWNRKAAREGSSPFVFCSSLADVFDNAVDPAWRRDLFELIRATPNLTWLLLTKRPGMIVKLFIEAVGHKELGDERTLAECWPRNAAIGCTVVTQEEADRDIPKLLAAKAALKPAFAFLSMEPLLGPVDLRPWLRDLCPNCHRPGCEPTLRADSAEVFSLCGRFVMETPGPGLDWVITGGETDQAHHKARPASPRWYRNLRDQCAAADVPFLFKQWGEWAPGHVAPSDTPGTWAFGDYEHDERPYMHVTDRMPRQFTIFGARALVKRVGKARAGRVLDGRTHNARPVVARAAQGGLL